MKDYVKDTAERITVNADNIIDMYCNIDEIHKESKKYI